MIDNFKSMVLTMSIFKGTNSSEYSIINTIMIMLLVSFIDTIVLQIKRLFSNFEAYITNRTNSSLIKVKYLSLLIISKINRCFLDIDSFKNCVIYFFIFSLFMALVLSI